MEFQRSRGTCQHAVIYYMHFVRYPYSFSDKYLFGLAEKVPKKNPGQSVWFSNGQNYDIDLERCCNEMKLNVLEIFTVVDVDIDI